MKNPIRSILMLLIAANTATAQCTQPACENLPATITANVSPPAPGVTYTYDWTLSVPFTGQGSAQVQLATVGVAPATIPYQVAVTDNVTGCESVIQCEITVTKSAPVVLSIPDYCPGAAPFDVSPYVSPSGATLSGSALTGNMYDPAIGGPVTATPPPGGCLTASTQTPGILSPPSIISTTVTQ
jgi:hypothetical protein